MPARSVRHGERPRKTPAHLNDFVCYDARIEEPLSPLQKGSLGTRYPITRYVTSANFSISHQLYLAALMKVVEPRFYSEVVREPQW